MPHVRSSPIPEDLARLIKQLGGISPERIQLHPPPGQATEKDLIQLLERTGVICELVDGILVEKMRGLPESFFTVDLIKLLGAFIDRHDLGLLAGPDGTLKMMKGLVHIPDIAFISWAGLPGRERPAEPIPELVPDLAIEVLSENNTREEMKQKLKEYFLAGIPLVWFFNQRQSTVEVFTAPDRSVQLTEKDILEGGNVLPGLKLPLREVFAKVARESEKKPRKKRRKGDEPS